MPANEPFTGLPVFSLSAFDPNSVLAVSDIGASPAVSKKITIANLASAIVGQYFTADEITQLQNIDTSTISTTQWSYLGAADQHVHTASDVVFKKVDIKNGAYLGVTLETFGITLQNTAYLELKSTGFFHPRIVCGPTNILDISDGGAGIRISTLGPVEFISTSNAMIVTKMTTAQKNAIATPQNGMILYDTDLNKFQGYEGGTWTSFI
jgi:hypothetical protein